MVILPREYAMSLARCSAPAARFTVARRAPSIRERKSCGIAKRVLPRRSRYISSQRATIVADVRDFDPDVIIIDIAMPDTNGWDAAREVRQRRLPLEKRPVLIALSGKYTKGDKILAEMSAYDYYVIHPCDPKALLELVALHARE